MRFLRSLFCFIACGLLALNSFSEGKNRPLFPDLESREEFAQEISFLVEAGWKIWQDAILVNDIYVDGSRGVLSPGDLKGPVLSTSGMLANFDRTDRSQDYINCVRVVAEAVENGMRKWQRNYTNRNIPFPRGASCTYTLPPTNNVPVAIASGESSGDIEMTGEVLYNYMLYRSPRQNKDVIEVLRVTAKAISECFTAWKNECSISEIVASGGIAPQPAPMGPGPGLVRGAKGQNGKLTGAYFSGDLMRSKMIGYFRRGA